MKLSLETVRMLEDLEKRIDPVTEDDFLSQWDTFLSRRFSGNSFIPERKRLSPPAVGLPQININDAINDYELMLASQLVPNFRVLESRTGCLGVRTNYGTGILSSLFGAEIFTMPYEMDTLPTTRAFSGTDDIQRLLDRGIPSFDKGFGKRVFEMGGVFLPRSSPAIPGFKNIFPCTTPTSRGLWISAS